MIYVTLGFVASIFNLFSMIVTTNPLTKLQVPVTSTMLVDLCTNLAPMAAIFVFMAPMPTIGKIRQSGSVGALPLLPYSSMVGSTFLWTVYGLLVGEFKVWSPNFVGLVLGAYYMTCFMKYAPKSAPTLPGSLRQHQTGVIAVMGATLLLAATLAQPAAYIGPCGVTLTIAMFASPLSALRTVLQTKSAASIPLPFTLASLANCLFWSVAGLFKMKDANIYVPNLLGLTFSLVQAGLKLAYGDGPYGEATKLPT